MPPPFDKTINQLDAALYVDDLDKFVLTQDGATKRCNAAQIRAGARPGLDVVLSTETVRLAPTATADTFVIATEVHLADGSVTFELPADAVVGVHAAFYFSRNGASHTLPEIRVDGIVRFSQPGQTAITRLMCSRVFEDPAFSGRTPPTLAVEADTVCGVDSVELLAGLCAAELLAVTPLADGENLKWNAVACTRLVLTFPRPVTILPSVRLTEDGVTRTTEDTTVRITEGLP